jgi:hypothetical protein
VSAADTLPGDEISEQYPRASASLPPVRISNINTMTDTGESPDDDDADDKP